MHTRHSRSDRSRPSRSRLTIPCPPICRCHAIVAAAALAVVGLGVPVAARAQPAAVPDCAPPVAQTVDAAMRAFDADNLPRDDWERRARRAGWVPDAIRLQAGARTLATARSEARLDQDFDGAMQAETYELADVERSGHDTTTTWQLTASWDLARLVWSGEEPGIERADRERAARREALVERVVAFYFGWASTMWPPEHVDDAHAASRRRAAPVDRTWAAAHDAAMLDALTGGWFARENHCGGSSQP